MNASVAFFIFSAIFPIPNVGNNFMSAIRPGIQLMWTSAGFRIHARDANEAK